MARTPVHAAGGIVLRQAKPPLIAVVRLRKRNEWVLPKGKLDEGETPRDAAEREVNEETGHDVIVHEFLGTLVYESSGRSKIVHYWRMQADGEQVYELMTDIREVDWVPLEVALVRLSRASERAFLESVGPTAVRAAIADQSKRKAKAASATKAAPATKAAAGAKAAPAKKRSTRPAVPAKLPAAPVQPPVELPPAAPDVPELVASEPADGAPMLERQTQEPVTIEQRIEQPEPLQSQDAVEAVTVRAQADPPACEPVRAVVHEVDPALPAEAADVPATDAAETRRKSLGERLRNWLGSVA